MLRILARGIPHEFPSCARNIEFSEKISNHQRSIFNPISTPQKCRNVLQSVSWVQTARPRARLWPCQLYLAAQFVPTLSSTKSDSERELCQEWELMNDTELFTLEWQRIRDSRTLLAKRLASKLLQNLGVPVCQILDDTTTNAQI